MTQTIARYSIFYQKIKRRLARSSVGAIEIIEARSWRRHGGVENRSMGEKQNENMTKIEILFEAFFVQ